VRATACIILLLSACSSHTLRCDQHLRPINTSTRTSEVDAIPLRLSP
jgi:hypothetical protein